MKDRSLRASFASSFAGNSFRWRTVDRPRIVVAVLRPSDPSVPSFDQVYAQLNEERVNLRARRYLRDLRRDAVIDYR